jgi:hypothetical protein
VRGARKQFAVDVSEAGPPAERMFAVAGIVMEPKAIWSPSPFARPVRVYGPYVRGHYEPVAESPCWRMYRRSVTPGSQR